MNQLAINGGPKAKPTSYNQPNKYTQEERDLLLEVLDSGKLMGPGGKITEFETELCQAFNVKHAIMVTSGTIALQTALAALGVAEGDEVITTSMTDFGTTAAILALHAIPIFADIDLSTRLLDPEKVRKKITDKTKAVIIVHMAGMLCEMDAFMAISNETGVKILEDCAQAHGATYHGQFVGTIGHAGGFSMNESKLMSTGDGGFVTTNDDQTGEIARLYRDKTYLRDQKIERGMQPIPFFGTNLRPTNLHAAVAIAQLHKLEHTVARRDQIVRRYYNDLADLPHLDFPKIATNAQPAWWPLAICYTGTDPTRDQMVDIFRAEGIPINTSMSAVKNILRTQVIQTRKYYPLTDDVPAFWQNTTYDPNSCPNVDALQSTCLRLPVDERYTDEDIDQTIAAVKKVWGHYF
ncbi:MAG: DegT/DnrJ/EryC1/StrS family aminotransferase [Candidatus Latescibacteria bacterium]|jgi:dTDP-4-amino-4,6-dideoxygalactose transaminase|nr:DegT/DnrJ/EryC1/StrS family aminotransferase [Candidatus Latescibacterota bacterium]